MNLGRTIIYLLMVMCFSWSYLQVTAQETSDCDRLEISLRVTNTTNGLDNGRVSISAQGGAAPYYYVFYHETGHLITQENTKNVLSGLPPGSFFCSVVDANGCTKKVKIDIK